MKKSGTAVVVVICLIVLGALYTIFSREPGMTQPIAFNHKLHTEDVGLECIECHQYFMEHRHSGLPDEEVCGTCHEEPMTDSPEEQKLVSMIEAGEGLHFRKLFRLADHVYYSHRRHVAIAELPCEGCHGGIATTVSPPERPLVKIDMNFCIDCHIELDVTTDCVACHG